MGVMDSYVSSCHWFWTFQSWFHVIHFYFQDCPWPNIVVEVAYTESVEHVLEKVKNYWLKPNRAHDAIVVKIDPVPAGDRPIYMKVSYFYIVWQSSHLYHILKILAHCRYGTTAFQTE